VRTSFRIIFPEELSMTRKISLAAFAAAQCLVFGLAGTTPASAAEIPSYFFSQWTVTSNCAEAHAGPAAHVPSGLQFKISSDSVSSDGTVTLQTIDAGNQKWAREWSGVKLEYRPGTKMTTVPADFECVEGAEASSAAASPFLAMSGYVQMAEPQYPQQHWYGLAKIHGQLEHVLIFPRDVKGDKSAIIVLQSASNRGNITLDDDGIVNSKD
jgi:hypothetical protein